MGLILALFFILSWGGWKIYPQNPVWTASGENRDDNFADKVVGAGDVNGDGYSDVAVWGSSYDHNRG